jgi:hypothetical protein
MALNEDQWTEMYRLSVQNGTNIEGIMDELSRFRVEIKDCNGRVNDLEINQGVQRGKVTFLAVTITAFLTIVSNGAFWLYSHAGGAK